MNWTCYGSKRWTSDDGRFEIVRRAFDGCRHGYVTRLYGQAFGCTHDYVSEAKRACVLKADAEVSVREASIGWEPVL